MLLQPHQQRLTLTTNVVQTPEGIEGGGGSVNACVLSKACKKSRKAGLYVSVGHTYDMLVKQYAVEPAGRRVAGGAATAEGCSYQWCVGGLSIWSRCSVVVIMAQL